MRWVPRRRGWSTCPEDLWSASSKPSSGAAGPLEWPGLAGSSSPEADSFFLGPWGGVQCKGPNRGGRGLWGGPWNVNSWALPSHKPGAILPGSDQREIVAASRWPRQSLEGTGCPSL